ncbi:exo-alpha-sialidase [Paenibacillus albicereus]|uniref:Exo-alpha-sialidase n=1 Tax=Paenibacillus albicereus TaxID=2726185 RepID=A0A6H2H4B8_9BACL|nr:exo-alpha-sialidase [Paenibacillus albicereus]
MTPPGTNPKFEPSVAVNLLNPSIMVATATDTTSGVPQIGLYRSLNGGATWSNALLPLPAGFTGAEAAVVGYAFPSTFYVSAHVFPGASDGTTYLYKSIDNGATFAPPVLIAPGYGTYINNDETNTIVDTAQSSPYLGNVYVTYNHQFNVANNGNSVAFLNRSRDGGATWDQPVLLSSDADQVERPDAAVDLVGNVCAGWITVNPTYRFVIRVSSDGATTFRAPVTVSTIVPVPTVLPVTGYAFRVLTFANLSADRSIGPYTGNIYAVWQDFRQGYSNIFMSISTDTGTTWSAPVSITGAPAGSQNFFPAIDVDPLTGCVNIIYYSNQVNGFDLDVYVARSINGGQSFTNTRITDVSFNPNGTSPTPVPLIGDYIDIVSVPPGGYIGIWTNTSNSLYIVAGYSNNVIT